jgi:hypothetical protein
MIAEQCTRNSKIETRNSLSSNDRGEFRISSFEFRLAPLLVTAFMWISLPFAATAAQRLVDRIVATIEGEPVTASELADLGKFQQLQGGPPAEEKELLRRRIEIWIVLADAQAARFPAPAAADVQSELDRLSAQVGTPEAYQARLRELGLRAESARRLMAQQLWVARYLDARFRPTAQVDEKQVQAYYQNDLAKELAARGQSLPPFDTVRDKILELLIQREMSERAGRWLDENRARTRVVVRNSTK